jgi:hypothetical protein
LARIIRRELRRSLFSQSLPAFIAGRLFWLQKHIGIKPLAPILQRYSWDQTFIAEERFRSKKQNYDNTWVFDKP